MKIEKIENENIDHGGFMRWQHDPIITEKINLIIDKINELESKLNLKEDSMFGILSKLSTSN